MEVAGSGEEMGKRYGTESEELVEMLKDKVFLEVKEKAEMDADKYEEVQTESETELKAEKEGFVVMEEEFDMVEEKLAQVQANVEEPKLGCT